MKGKSVGKRRIAGTIRTQKRTSEEIATSDLPANKAFRFASMPDAE